MIKINLIKSVKLMQSSFQSIDSELRFCVLECERDDGESVVIQGTLEQLMYQVRFIF